MYSDVEQLSEIYKGVNEKYVILVNQSFKLKNPKNPK